ncbi:tRNA lysidine(34) synthetase TilS [Cellulomonas sp. P24]|uniref:tRNA lysidine(34) synthetase TilS n=1 Tax=Cellulomonas sp. P24 TaxID=2885206 RepID=UPI00216B357B|nr:tRNA lysidine(34) synthetase TilS [Cellulomonas sp. P24]MCR6493359.1 tRNA lysidine(34) synthetase TilS [Cellulomonas sp. P24]
MSGPAPAVARARLAVRADLADLPVGSLVLVACSGGPDSLALAAATAFVAPRAGVRAGAVVVDHGLQPGSDAVAAEAARACRELGLAPVVVVRVDVGRSSGPEADAREARHAAFDATAAELGAQAVLLGHTLDDQAEQVLLGLARGSGARSLSGMPARRGLLRRPLLGLPREDTVAVCAASGLVPWDDPTNAVPWDDPTNAVPWDDPTNAVPWDDRASAVPLRSRVRHQVLPVLEQVLGPGVVGALARTADQLREDVDTLELLGAELFAAARVEGAPTIALDVAVVAAAPLAVRRRALRAALVAAGCPSGSVSRTHVLAVDRLLTDWHGQGPVALPGRVVARRRCGRLEVEPDAPIEAPAAPTRGEL